MNSTFVTIIIPTFNEEAPISQGVKQLAGALPEAELIVVDDGSNDTTARAAAEAGATVSRQLQIQGYGAALRSGYCNLLVTMSYSAMPTVNTV